MAVDMVCMPFSPQEACLRPSKRRRLVWDVPDPALLAEATCLQFHPASQLFQDCTSPDPPQGKHLTGFCMEYDTDVKDGTEKISAFGIEAGGKGGCKQDPVATSPWMNDDEDGHFNFLVGDYLASRYKILQKIGEGTFGRVLECLDQEAEEVVAIKVVRSVEKYREAAMIEIDHLQTLARNDRLGSRGKAYKYFRHGRELIWPDKCTSRESVRAVNRLPKLRDFLQRHVEKSSGSLLNLLEGMFSYDPSERLTAREALRHPFFQGSVDQ